MRNRLVGSFAFLAMVGTALGTPVEKWVQTTKADFEGGEAKGIAVLALGQLALAPDLKPLLAESVARVWALSSPDAKGTLYAATGLGAKLLRIQGEKVETFFTSPNKADLEILAVALAPDGAVLASAAPSGTLYRVTPDGKATALFKSSDPYLWSLATDPDGSVFAATGPNAKLLKITPDGKATTVLTANASHLLCVLRAPDGSLYVGTDKKGLLYHVGPQGASRVVYDAGESDIRALALDPKGALYFATAAPAGGPEPRPSPPAPPSKPATISVRVGPEESTQREQEGDEPPPPQPQPKAMPSRPPAQGPRAAGGNSLYRLAPNGDVARVLSLPGVAFYSLAWHNGHLYAGTGNEGKLYRIEDDQAIQVARLPESQITALAVAEGRLVVGTANVGQVHRVVADHAPSGTFLSDAFDTASLSRFGQIKWRASVPPGTGLTLATRTGNVAEPDASWSAWSAEQAWSQGSRMAGPPARFIQYRVTLKTTKADATPVLDEVVLAYQQSNAPPQFTQVTVGKPPKQRPAGPPPQPGQEVPPPPAPSPRSVNTSRQPAVSPRGPFADRIRVSWQASDANKDELRFSLFFRGEDETTWKKVKENLVATFYDWDSTAVPDGLYRFRVVASDIGSNTPDQALQKEHLTEAFVVDNTPPAVEEVKARVNPDRTVAVTAKCSDAGCGLAAAEYSIDAGEWASLAPTDGIFDANVETVEFRTAPLERGEHSIVIRARDDAENTGAGKAVVKVE